MINSDQEWANLKAGFEQDAISTCFDVLLQAGLNVQIAPFPKELHDLVIGTKYRKGWHFWLIGNDERDQGEQHSRGLTLIVQIYEPDTYHPETMMRVNHKFIVPAATYDRAAWQALAV